jgi:GGDEF domain-containing protein
MLDALTGLPNRRCVTEELNRLIAHCRRTREIKNRITESQLIKQKMIEKDEGKDDLSHGSPK